LDPSGDQSAFAASRRHGVSRFNPLPSARTTKIAASRSFLTRVKLIRVPSGDQSVFVSYASGVAMPVTSRRGSLPSALATKIPWTFGREGPASWSNAILVPSGE